MTDLHGWITQQVDKVEAIARAADETLGEVLSQVEYVDKHTVADERHINLHAPAAVLRRCVADRKILSDHTSFGDGSVHCVGCGVDYETGPLVDNVNDCPTLLSLAEGHGLTEEQRAQLDRPEAAPVVARPRGPIPDTSRVPAALRGPNWKRHP
ncbi:DUF6221 family protein [Streptomyces sp. NPDC048200]|uniref:DUF6221 family protein n=1 Tax=Streptomyces sp. NPDC048200 TaxID=3365512 RepID=UPI003714D912